jgi:hypothetical protein
METNEMQVCIMGHGLDQDNWWRNKTYQV